MVVSGTVVVVVEVVVVVVVVVVVEVVVVVGGSGLGHHNKHLHEACIEHLLAFRR